MRQRRRAGRVLMAAVLAVGFIRCGSPSATDLDTLDAAGGSGILFIGNSLTDANDLPERVRDLARDGGSDVRVSEVVGSGFSLADHIASSRAVSTIRRGGWSMVVLQQGPSTLPASRAALIADGTVLVQEARAVSARAGFLSVWPLPGQRFEDVSASYRAAAEATGTLLFPAGDAWQAALLRDPSLRLVVEDGFHPSPLGTYLAALTIHCTLHGAVRPARSLATERDRTGVALTAAQSVLLREAACGVRR